MYGRNRRLQGGVVGRSGGKGRIMSRVPGLLGRLGAGLTELGARLDERRAEVEKESGGSLDLIDETDDRSPRDSTTTAWTDAKPSVSPADAAPEPIPEREPGSDSESEPSAVSAAHYIRGPETDTRPDPVLAVPWGVRVAAEA